MAEVRFENVRKSFGAVDVIHGLDLEVPDGSFAVVVGPSGCGKSTLLRITAGLETASSGRVMIGARDVTHAEPRDRDVAMVFQNYALFPHLTVARNIAFGLELRGTPKAEIAERVARAAAVLRLDGLLDRKPRQLSGGQRQRVAMGRAIVRQPEVFLFDEPLSNLDAQLRGDMRVEMKRLHQTLGTTSIWVTHDQVEAMTMGDLLVVMNGGRIEQIGTPIEVWERPASTFVARFIGSPPMNLMPGRLDGDRVVVDPAEAPRSNDPAASVIGVRPEHWHVADEAALLDLHVEVVEPLGSETLLHGRAAGHAVAVRLAADRRVRPGERVPLAVARHRVHVFHAATGARREAVA